MKQFLRQSWFRPGLVKRPSVIHGIGVFTSVEIPEGAIVMVWGGLLIPRTSYEDTWQMYRNGSIVQVSEEYFLGTLRKEPETIDESLNHSCDPNIWFTDEVTLVARRTINKDEEITLDSAL